MVEWRAFVSSGDRMVEVRRNRSAGATRFREGRGAMRARAAAVVRCYHGRPREEWYDLRADPHEMNTLAAAGVGLSAIE